MIGHHGSVPISQVGVVWGQGNFGRVVERVSMWVVSKCSSFSFFCPRSRHAFLYITADHRLNYRTHPLFFLIYEHVDCKVCTAVCVMSAFHLLFKPRASCLPQPSSEPSRLLFFYAHSPFRSPSSSFFSVP